MFLERKKVTLHTSEITWTKTLQIRADRVCCNRMVDPGPTAYCSLPRVSKQLTSFSASSGLHRLEISLADFLTWNIYQGGWHSPAITITIFKSVLNISWSDYTPNLSLSKEWRFTQGRLRMGRRILAISWVELFGNLPTGQNEGFRKMIISEQ